MFPGSVNTPFEAQIGGKFEANGREEGIVGRIGELIRRQIEHGGL